MNGRTSPAASGRPLARLRPHSRGQALVEFALVLIPLMFLFLGAIDLGRVFLAQITISNAARAGAIQAAVAPTSDDNSDCTAANYSSNRIICSVQNETGQRGGASTLTVKASDVTVTCEDSGGSPVACSSQPQLGQRVRVSITSHFPLITPLLQAFFGSSSLNLSASAIADQQELPTPAVPTPGPTPTPTPTAGPTPTPTPTPVSCTVPNFVTPGVKGKDAAGVWTGAGFSGANLTNNVPGNSKVSQQSLGAGTSQPCATAAITLN